MTISNQAVCERWLERRSGRSATLSTDGRFLYSYEAPIGAWVGDYPLVDGVRYSATTSSHQVVAVRTLADRGYKPVLTSFYLLKGIGVLHYDLEPYSPYPTLVGWPSVNPEAEVLDCCPDSSRPAAGVMRPEESVERFRSGPRYCTPSSVLVRAGREYYLVARDGRQFFAALLPEKALTITEAFRVLRPKGVRDGKYLRQGEWFFIPASAGMSTWRFWQVAERHVALPGGSHRCTRLIKVGKSIYVSGCVRHPQHGVLKLGKTVFRAVKNRAVRSWTLQGVD